MALATAGRGDMIRGFDLAHLSKPVPITTVGPIQPTAIIRVEEKGKCQQVFAPTHTL